MQIKATAIFQLRDICDNDDVKSLKVRNGLTFAAVFHNSVDLLECRDKGSDDTQMFVLSMKVRAESLLPFSTAALPLLGSSWPRLI